VIWSAFSFLADHLSLMHGLGALLGAGGTAAYFLVPGLAPLFAVAANAFSLVLSNRLGCALLAGGLGIYGGLLYGTHQADLACGSKVAALIAQSQADAKTRDAAIAADLEAKYAPTVTALQAQSDNLQKQVADYAAKIGNSRACLLGAEPLRLRQLK
jgi:hypothetical protein